MVDQVVHQSPAPQDGPHVFFDARIDEHLAGQAFVRQGGEFFAARPPGQRRDWLVRRA